MFAWLRLARLAAKQVEILSGPRALKLAGGNWEENGAPSVGGTE